MNNYFKPYVYIISNKYGFYYIGVRYSKNSKRKDIMNGYYTSSNIIKQMLKSGEIFCIENVIEFDNHQEAVLYESVLIKEHINDYFNLNGNVASGVVYKPMFRKLPDEYGLTSYQKGAIKAVKSKLAKDKDYFKKRVGNLNKDISSNIIKTKNTLDNKMINGIRYRDIQSNNMKINNPMFDDEIKKKSKLKIKKYYINENNEQKLKRIEKQKLSYIENNSGKKHSEWMKINNPTKKTIWVNNGKICKRVKMDEIPNGFKIGRIVSIQKEKTKVCCPHCNLIGSISNMKRYHFENCKELK